ncbi:MAG: hypothetical protein ACJAUQ_001588 [Maribacter sp.]|jgi:hypothetical protein
MKNSIMKSIKTFFDKFIGSKQPTKEGKLVLVYVREKAIYKDKFHNL